MALGFAAGGLAVGSLALYFRDKAEAARESLGPLDTALAPFIGLYDTIIQHPFWMGTGITVGTFVGLMFSVPNLERESALTPLTVLAGIVACGSVTASIATGDWRYVAPVVGGALGAGVSAAMCLGMLNSINQQTKSLALATVIYSALAGASIGYESADNYTNPF